MNFNTYNTDGFYDELFTSSGDSRPSAKLLIEKINALPKGEFKKRQEAAELMLLNTGITFTVTGDKGGLERIFPFDIVPRIIDGKEWKQVENGLKQRATALNLFLDDIYHDQKILKDGIIPQEIALSSVGFLKECVGLNPPQKIWAHISGTDLVRDTRGQFYVLEDNMRCPSGVSYVLENRHVMKKAFPKVFRSSTVEPIDDYSEKLLETLQYLSPMEPWNSKVAVLTPGIYNSAYFEHSYLAQKMGASLVEGRDLIVQDKKVYMRTTKGFEKIDVIYRRIDDTFLDPQVFRSDSLLGVPGLMQAYLSGNIAIANAPGTGIADDKVIYKYVPAIIEYYLLQDAILPNVPTYICSNPKERAHVLGNLEKLVVKSANESGGYGMLIGPDSSKKERKEFAKKIQENPRNFLAQPTLALSRAPTMIKGKFEGRHVDLRPYILYGKEVFVMPGGLTRVALRKGSLVVNSSQGGGSKDTWITRQPEEDPSHA